MLPSKTNMRYSKEYCKKQLFLFKWDYMINYNENEGENEK